MRPAVERGSTLKGILGVVAAGVLTAWLCGTLRAATQEEGAGAYGRLDPRKLAETLSRMGMGHLLEAYIKDSGLQGESLESVSMLADSKIAQARAPGVDLRTRDRLLSEAVGDLEKVVKLTAAKAEAPDAAAEDVKAHFAAELKMIDVEALLRVQPCAIRLMYLQGGPADQDVIVEMTAQAARRLDVLNRDIEAILQRWRRDLKTLLNVPELELLQSEVTYKSGWVRFYRGMALPPTPERSRLLRDAIGDMSAFAKGDEESGVKYWALLLSGMASREMKQHGEAQKYLSQANTDSAGTEVRIQAMFELARNLIEQDLFQEGLKSVETFRGEAARLLGKPGQIEIDVKSSLLLNCLYADWAVKETDPAKAQDYERRSQEVLLDFIQKHPEVAEPFIVIIAAKFRNAKDVTRLNSVVLLAVAVDLLSQRTAEAEAKAEEHFRRILSRDAADPVRPEAVWRLAMLMNERRQNLAAGRFFMELAEKYPAHKLAQKAALNSVITLNGVIGERQRTGEIIAKNLREEFVRAIELLRKNWPTDREALAWLFELGWQCQELAKVSDEAAAEKLLNKAADAYEQVPAGRPEYMEARRFAGDVRYRLIVDFPGEAKDKERKAESLVRRLLAYAMEAGEAATKADAAARWAKDPGAAEAPRKEAKALREWGAMAEFQAAALQYEHLQQQAQAMVVLEKLPEKWAGTSATEDASEYRVRKLIEQGRTDEAIKRLEEFRDRQPEKAQHLIQLILRQIEDRIEKLRDAPAAGPELHRYQEAYSKFARDLFKRAAGQGLEQRYAVTQLYAGALVEEGSAAAARNDSAQAHQAFNEALRLFQECKALDDAGRKLQADAIDAEIAVRVKALQDARDSVPRAEGLVSGYLEELKKLQVEPGSLAAAMALQGAARDLADTKADAEQRKRNVAEVLKRLKAAYESLGDVRRRRLPIDAGNIHGLAKTHRALKQYDKAGEHYKDLLAGIDRNAHSRLYWRIELEYCQCLLEGYRGDPKMMRNLMLRIRQLGMEEPDMPFRHKFNKVESEARKLAEAGK